jgi:hypothetical protein
MVIAEISTGSPARNEAMRALGFWHCTAKDHIFNFFRIKLRHAFESALYGNGGEFIGTSGPERAFESAPHGSTDGRDDEDFTHGYAYYEPPGHEVPRRDFPRLQFRLGFGSLQIFDKRIGDVRACIVSHARCVALHILHQSIQIIARRGNADYAYCGLIPEIARIQLGNGDIKMSTQAIFHAAYNLPFIFEGLRRFDAKFEGEESDQSRRLFKGCRWSFVVGSIPHPQPCCLELDRTRSADLAIELCSAGQPRACPERSRRGDYPYV